MARYITYGDQKIDIDQTLYELDLVDAEESLAAFFTSPWYTAMRDHLGKWGLKGAWLDKYRADLIEPFYDPGTGKAKPRFFDR